MTLHCYKCTTKYFILNRGLRSKKPSQSCFSSKSLFFKNPSRSSKKEAGAPHQALANEAASFLIAYNDFDMVVDGLQCWLLPCCAAGLLLLLGFTKKASPFLGDVISDEVS